MALFVKVAWSCGKRQFFENNGCGGGKRLGEGAAVPARQFEKTWRRWSKVSANIEIMFIMIVVLLYSFKALHNIIESYH